jgi:hypothetical protein
VDTFLGKHPSGLVIITGDFNPTSTGFRPAEVTRACSLKQRVTFRTRDSGILDLIFTNKSELYDTPIQLPKIGNSDHYTVLITPKQHLGRKIDNTQGSKVYRRDLRESNWKAFGSWLVRESWQDTLNESDCQSKYDNFMQKMNSAIDLFLPLKRSKVNKSDKPWITNQIKKWIKKRQKAFCQYGKLSSEYKKWRNKIRAKTKTCRRDFYANQMNDFIGSNISKWWKTIKKLTCEVASPPWSQYLMGQTGHTTPLELANEINTFFSELTRDFQPLVQPLDVRELFVPPNLKATPHQVQTKLNAVNGRKAVGPDKLNNRILKEFSQELSVVLADIYNTTLTQAYVPDLLKASTIVPIPKILPPKTIEEDLRPISLTCQISKVFESLTLDRLMPEVEHHIDTKQFANKGKSTKDALVSILHNIHTALDNGDTAVRIFFTDFTKGFDLIDHNILLAKLAKLGVSDVLIRWIAAFLTNRKQRVRVDGVLSEWKYPKGGIPQGTKLGPLLFLIMVNDLVKNWPGRAKFVDDLVVVETIPRNSISVMDLIAREIQQYCMDHKMKLNPKKCKEMFVNFMTNPNILSRDLVVNGTQIESVDA